MSRTNELKISQKDLLDYLGIIDSKIWILLLIAFSILYSILISKKLLFKIENKVSFWNTIRLFVNQCMIFQNNLIVVIMSRDELLS